MAVKSAAQERLREGAAAVAEWAAGTLRPAALPLALLAIYCAGAWGLWLYAAGRSGRPSVPEIDARQCPWLAPADLAAINSGVARAGESSLFDRDLCRRIAGCCQDSPWVERVVAVRRRFPDRVEVALVIRQPFASVHRAGLYHLVDHLGCRLPVPAAIRPDGRYPVIDGVASAPPAPGDIWNDECLDDSLRLAGLLGEVLADRGPVARLTAIEAAKPAHGHDTRPQMVAQLASGARIDWGSFNEARTCAFPSVSDKRGELERQLKLISDLSTVSCIRVRYRDGVVIPRPEPLASGPIGMLP
jgi:hypothetical protein